MAGSETLKVAKKYPYPANLYKTVYPDANCIDRDTLAELLDRVCNLPKGFKHLVYLYFYKKMPYFDIGLKYKFSSTKARALVLEVISSLANSYNLGNDIDFFGDENYPKDFLNPPESVFNTNLNTTHTISSGNGERNVHKYEPPEGSYTYLEPIGEQHEDYWTGSINHSNRNLTNSSDGKFDARMKSFEKREKALPSLELDCIKDTSSDKTEKDKFDGFAIKDCPYKVCKYWPSNLISRVFSSGYRMPITDDQYAALNGILLNLKETDPTSLACLLLVYMYDRQYSRISADTGIQPYAIKKKVSGVIRLLSSSKCRGYLYYGLKGFENRKNGAIKESLQKNLLYCSTFSAGIVEQFADRLNIHTMDELLGCSAEKLVVVGNFPNAALSEIYTVLTHLGYETFHDGSPLSDLVSVGKIRYYRGRGNTLKAAENEGA